MTVFGDAYIDAGCRALGERAYQRGIDEAAERDGLLDPDQPTQTAHNDAIAALIGEA